MMICFCDVFLYVNNEIQFFKNGVKGIFGIFLLFFWDEVKIIVYVFNDVFWKREYLRLFK